MARRSPSVSDAARRARTAFVNAPRAILEWVRARLVLIILVILVAVPISSFVIVGVFDPEWVHSFFFGEFDKNGKVEAKKFRILEFIGIGMGGVLLIIGATIANRRAVAMERTANEQAVANRGAEDGRRQERLKTAIEHLGHESDSVRLGGAYELFHLAQDAEDLSQTAMDIFCAHIRRMTGEAKYRKDHESEPSTEIQNLLTLLFIQEHGVFTERRIDLQGSWLNGAMLERAHLQGANFAGAHLQRARLHGARLQRAHLAGAHLQRARLHGARLQRAHLAGARLHRAFLRAARLQGADLAWARLQGAYLTRTQLQGANLFGAQLQGANLFGAQLQGANLARTQLQGANLFGVHLQGADLAGAQLQGVVSQRTGRSFGEHIRVKIDQKGDLSGVMFAGGLSREDMASLVQDLPGEEAKELREKLEPHVGKPASNELPEGSGAIVESYTAEEAERWIAEYAEATGEV